MTFGLTVVYGCRGLMPTDCSAVCAALYNSGCLRIPRAVTGRLTNPAGGVRSPEALVDATCDYARVFSAGTLGSHRIARSSSCSMNLRVAIVTQSWLFRGGDVDPQRPPGASALHHVRVAASQLECRRGGGRCVPAGAD